MRAGDIEEHDRAQDVHDWRISVKTRVQLALPLGQVDAGAPMQPPLLVAARISATFPPPEAPAFLAFIFALRTPRSPHTQLTVRAARGWAP